MEKTQNSSKIFLSYASEDEDIATKLYNDLTQLGIRIWFDKHDLLGGGDIEFIISNAIRECRFFLTLLSQRSLTKTGYFQKELARAFTKLDTFPANSIYLIPVRLDECNPQDERIRGKSWINMFPLWSNGIDKIVKTISTVVSIDNNTTPIITSTNIDKRSLILQILKAALLSYFEEIRNADTKNNRDQAISNLMNYLEKANFKVTFKMSDIVFMIFIDDCVKSSNFIDPDLWITERIKDMGDLPKSHQQVIFSFAVDRFLTMI
ncbi:MAG: toll/interleukin-1 receptor domain-containing protein [Bacteroidia bacterium]|nr:toll/interleukin-1 receptor domain-containing protein [Bacteroidia bacterium]